MSTVFEGDDRQYALTRLSGWLELVFGPDRIQPPRLTPRQMSELSALELVRYHDLRAVWHANLGPIKTPQMIDLHKALAEIVDSNRQDGDKANQRLYSTPTPASGRARRSANTPGTCTAGRLNCAGRPHRTVTGGSRSSTST